MDRWPSLWSQVCGLPPHPDVPGNQRLCWGWGEAGAWLVQFPLEPEAGQVLALGRGELKVSVTGLFRAGAALCPVYG